MKPGDDLHGFSWRRSCAACAHADSRSRFPAGLPLIDVRVGAPPSHRNSGYAVFTLDGELVEVMR